MAGWIGEDVSAFAALLQGRGRLLALDLGERTIGLAVSDDAWRHASPVRTLHRTKFQADADKLQAYGEREAITGYVLGLPVNMDGSRGKRVQSTRAFALNLARRDERPILLFDERLSTFEARDRAGAGRGTGKSEGRVDHLAAAVFLEDALKALSPYCAG